MVAILQQMLSFWFLMKSQSQSSPLMQPIRNLSNLTLCLTCLPRILTGKNIELVGCYYTSNDDTASRKSKFFRIQPSYEFPK